MAWRNLRGEIGEMFAELSSGEHLSEYVQGLLAKRHVLAKEKAERRYAYLRKYRALHPEKQKEWARISQRRRTIRKWAEEPSRICRHCWQEYKRPSPETRLYVYCSEVCRKAARLAAHREFMRAYETSHKDQIRERRQRWYQQNREKILAKQASDERTREYQRQYRAKRKAAREQAGELSYCEKNKERLKEKRLAYYHANKERINARIAEKRRSRRAAQKGTQP